MKIDGTPSALASSGPEHASGPALAECSTPAGDVDARTRDRVCRQVLGRGPVTATELAEALGLTSAAVRRHLDQLEADGLVTTWDQTGAAGPRPRGRPARRWVVTPTGHAAMTSAYDDLATAALRFLEDTAGPQAVKAFAESRVATLESRYAPTVEAAGPNSRDRAQALADALAGDGYAASTRQVQVGGVRLGTQLCQGHCPVQHVAQEFPQFCDAETEAFSRLLGVHVQRLATLAHGYHVCTTHVPDHAASVTGTSDDAHDSIAAATPCPSERSPQATSAPSPAQERTSA